VGGTGSGGGAGRGDPEAFLAGVDVEEGGGGAVQRGPGVMGGQPVGVHTPVARTLNCTKDKI